MAVATESLVKMIQECKVLVEQKNFNAVLQRLVILSKQLPSYPLQSEAHDIISKLGAEASKEASKGEADTESLIIRLENLRQNLLAFEAKGQKYAA